MQRVKQPKNRFNDEDDRLLLDACGDTRFRRINPSTGAVSFRWTHIARNVLHGKFTVTAVRGRHKRLTSRSNNASFMTDEDDETLRRALRDDTYLLFVGVNGERHYRWTLLAQRAFNDRFTPSALRGRYRKVFRSQGSPGRSTKAEEAPQNRSLDTQFPLSPTWGDGHDRALLNAAANVRFRQPRGGNVYADGTVGICFPAIAREVFHDMFKVHFLRDRHWRLTHPELCEGRWTADEEQRLWGLWERHGNRWRIIASHMRTRDARQCMTRFRSLRRKLDDKKRRRDEGGNSGTVATADVSSTTAPLPVKKRAVRVWEKEEGKGESTVKKEEGKE